MTVPIMCNHYEISGHQSVLGLSVAVLQVLERLVSCCPLASLMPWRAVCTPRPCFPKHPSGHCSGVRRCAKLDFQNLWFHQVLEGLSSEQHTGQHRLHLGTKCQPYQSD
ncbi:unnamed protein product [Symbiodinium sp. CCMP2592]|nr:unnamed protein product [Symbiodinium sp. CCMP2592]